jgi:hypothetical protein
MKYLSLIFCLVLCSCQYTPDGPEGKCHYPTKLPKNQLLFGVQGGVDSIFIEDTFWWIGEVSEEECERIGPWSNPDYCDNNYCRNGDVIMRMECSWFSVTKTSEHTILVSVNQNETGKERNKGVYVQAGNCGSSFTITQSAEQLE